MHVIMHVSRVVTGETDNLAFTHYIFFIERLPPMTKRNAPARKFLGDYRITDEVASSATSRIFLGETISSPRQSVAIKWSYTTHLDSQQEEGFRQETRLLQQLRHPSILPLITARSDKV